MNLATNEVFSNIWRNSGTLIVYPIYAAIGLTVFFLMVYLNKRYLEVSTKYALVVTLISAITCLLVIANPNLLPFYRQPPSLQFNLFNPSPLHVHSLPQGLLFLFAIPFCVKLYKKWIGGELNENEKKRGMEGIHAWLTPGNLICCFGIAFFSWHGYDANFWGVLFPLLCVIIMYPVLNMFSHMANKPPSPREDLSKAREKIFQLLENGKITVEESAELLRALSDNSDDDQADSKPVTKNN